MNNFDTLIFIILFHYHISFVVQCNKLEREEIYRCTRSIWCGNIAWSIEGSEIIMCWSSISWSKRIGKHFRSNTIDTTNKITKTNVIINNNLSILSLSLSELKREWKINLLVMAALRPSIGHIGSLRAPIVAEGLNTISAPFNPYAFKYNIQNEPCCCCCCCWKINESISHSKNTTSNSQRTNQLRLWWRP